MHVPDEAHKVSRGYDRSKKVSESSGILLSFTEKHDSDEP